MIECQAWRKKSGGFVVTNPNCSAIGLVMALKPLQDRFDIETVMAVTMQAVSGAGYPGVASLDILGNVIPYIPKEEEKMEEETRKLLGRSEWLGSRSGSIRPEHAMQSGSGRRRAYRIGVGEAEEEGASGRDDQGVERIS